MADEAATSDNSSRQAFRQATADVLARAQLRGRLFKDEQRMLEILARLVEILDVIAELRRDPSKIRKIQAGTKLRRECDALQQEYAGLNIRGGLDAS